MANLEKLTNKILEDSKKERERILAEGKEKALKEKEGIIKEAQIRANNIAKKYEEEASMLKERLISSENLKLRDELLKARGEQIERAFNKALEELKNISPETMVDFMKNSLKLEDLNDDVTAIVPEKYLEIVKSAYPNIKTEVDDKVMGFVLKKDGILKNYSFDRLLEYGKEDLEGLVAEKLFK